MIQRMILWFAKISGYFHWDVLRRIIGLLHRSDRLYLALRMLLDEVEYYSFRRDGILWTAFGWDLNLTWSLVEHGHFQGDQIQAVISWMDTNDRVTPHRNCLVDIGANIGTTSIPFAGNKECHVLAIEPFPENLALLRRNVNQNGLEHRITCIQSAVSNQSGTVRMAMTEGNCGSAAVHDPNEDINEPVRSIAEVPAAGLMDILESTNIASENIALVWSDTEGSEAKVVETGAPLWLAGVPLYIEVYPQALKKQNAEAALKRLLSRFFERFICVSDLIETGPGARPKPISEFPELMEDLSRMKDLTDVLLLPIGFKCKGDDSISCQD